MARRVENQFLLHQSNRTCITRTYILDISKKIKWKGNVTKGKSIPPPPITFKKEQTNKQKKQKQNKTNPWSRFLMSVINSCSASFSIFLKLPLVFNNVLIFRADVLIFRCNLFLQQRACVIFFKSEKVSDFTVCVILYIGSFYLVQKISVACI